MADRWDSGSDYIEGEYKVIDERDAGDVHHPSGGGRYLEMDPHPPYVTYVLLGLNIGAWILMTLAGMMLGLNLNEQLLIFGAKVNILVARGQYWRLFTAMFLHIGIMHLFFNSYALYLYGPVVEKLFGKAKFILVYLLSGLMGSLFSYLFSPNPAAGASGAIFGLMGSLLYFRQRKKDIFRRVFGPGLLMIIGFNLFYGFVQPGIDNWGHIGGLVGGFLLGSAVGLYRERHRPRRLVIWILILFVFSAGMWYGQQKYGPSIALHRALAAMQEGDLNAAEAHALQASKGFGNEEDLKQVLEAVYFTKARNHTEVLEFPQALEAVNALLSHYPGDSRYTLLRAGIFDEMEDYDAAYQDYAHVLSREEENGQLLYFAGRAAYRSGRFSEAREYLTRAVEKAPGLQQARDLLDELNTTI